LVDNENKKGAAACLMREKKRVGDIFRVCANTKFDTENSAALLQVVDHCIEYRLKL
jgi:hypothetical protein